MIAAGRGDVQVDMQIPFYLCAMQALRRLIYGWHNAVDERLKFPHLREGSVGIQVGFDMGFAFTSDLFKMARRAGTTGRVLGIDPDAANHKAAAAYMETHPFPAITLIEKATFNKQDLLELQLGEKASWNQLSNIPLDDTVAFREDTTMVQADTLDNIVADADISIHQIRHINITNNGAEYATLQGATRILREAERLSLSITTGRHDPSGTIDGRPDVACILELLQAAGYQVRFFRIEQSLWWGFFTKLLLNRKWVYGKSNYGVVLAAKGQSIPRWQSFS